MQDPLSRADSGYDWAIAPKSSAYFAHTHQRTSVTVTTNYRPTNELISVPPAHLWKES